MPSEILVGPSDQPTKCFNGYMDGYGLLQLEHFLSVN